MPEETLFESESRQSRAEVASYLRRVADKLDSGEEIALSAGDQSVALTVPDTLTFEVKVERESPPDGGPGELGLELELEWNEDGDDGDGPLTVE